MLWIFDLALSCVHSWLLLGPNPLWQPWRKSRTLVPPVLSCMNSSSLCWSNSGIWWLTWNTVRVCCPDPFFGGPFCPYALPFTIWLPLLIDPLLHGFICLYHTWLHMASFAHRPFTTWLHFLTLYHKDSCPLSHLLIDPLPHWPFIWPRTWLHLLMNPLPHSFICSWTLYHMVSWPFTSYPTADFKMFNSS